MIVKQGLDYWTGTVYTANRRVWEHDDNFKSYLTRTRATAIDMETATIFIVGFVNHIPKGALLLVSDSPMTPEGVKTTHSDQSVSEHYVCPNISKSASIPWSSSRNSGESVKTHAIRANRRRENLTLSTSTSPEYAHAPPRQAPAIMVSR